MKKFKKILGIIILLLILPFIFGTIGFLDHRLKLIEGLCIGGFIDFIGLLMILAINLLEN